MMRRGEVGHFHIELEKKISDIEPLLSAPKRDTEPVHQLYSYPAKFQAHVPNLLIEQFSKPGDVVLDPFGGGGTTLTSSVLQNRNAIHYDLSPLSCLVADAKTTPISKDDGEFLIKTLSSFRGKKANQSLISKEEEELFGKNVSKTANFIFYVITDVLTKKHHLSPIIAVLLIKFLKLCGRRDAEKRRDQTIEYHISWFNSEISKIAEYWKTKARDENPRKKIVCGSNHETHLNNESVDLIITSPPYAGVDIEYYEIQIQRRDLKRCYRSDVAIRISNIFYAGYVEKRRLCSGGELPDYFQNALSSLKEMRRVLKRGKLAFLYTGFKSENDRNRFEQTIETAGFVLHKRCDVTLSDDRVASSRSTHHGKDTNMMKRDYFYIVG